MSFLKWMGGKSQVLHIFKDYFPEFNNIKGYIEPFIGGANVYFYIMENWGGKLQGKPIFISDVNKELINCYRSVRNSVDKMIPLLEEHQRLNSEKHYYDVRKEYPPGKNMTNVEKAAAFIYLSRSAFGGLWRVNSQGKMNAPFNKNPNIKIIDRELKAELFNYAGLLKHAHINVMSFENILKINDGDLEGYFVYCCLPGTKIRMKDERLLDIEQIKIGDISFMGGRVVKTMSRNYVGNIYEFETIGIYDNLCVTEEHPVAIIRQEYVYEYKNKKMSKFKNQQVLDLLNIHFVRAKNINVGDFLLVPCYPGNVSSIKTVKIGEINIKCDEDFGWICGFWLAEGHIKHWDNNENTYDVKRILEIKKGKQTTLFDLDCEDLDKLIFESKYESSKTLAYSCGELDFELGFVDRLDRWYLHYFNCVGKIIQPDQINNPKTYQIYYYVEDMSKFLYKNFGELAKNKKISNEILNYPLEFQKGLLCGWLDGDGGIYGDEQNRCKITGTSVSKQLALDMYSIALRLGLRPLLKQRGKKEKKTIIGIECNTNLKFDVYFSSQDDVKYLYPDCHNFGNSKTRSQRRIITKGNKKFILTPITNILKGEYSGPVYNLTTENNIYVANYILNHNCDPPYAAKADINAFTGYSKDGYSASNRDLLPKVFKELDKRGAKVMMSNADVPAMRSTFSDFNIHVIQTNRQTGIQLSSITKEKMANTDKLNEVVITNYEFISGKKQTNIVDMYKLMDS